jgi:hypothetical protein
MKLTPGSSTQMQTPHAVEKLIFGKIIFWGNLNLDPSRAAILYFNMMASTPMTDWTDCAIKRDDAERIAREHVVASGSELSDFAFSVRTLAEVRQQRIRTPWIYGFPDESLATSWIVYVHDVKAYALKSSWIIVVSNSDGTVLYSGSANDEG